MQIICLLLPIVPIFLTLFKNEMGYGQWRILRNNNHDNNNIFRRTIYIDSQELFTFSNFLWISFLFDCKSSFAFMPFKFELEE